MFLHGTIKAPKRRKYRDTCKGLTAVEVEINCNGRWEYLNTLEIFHNKPDSVTVKDSKFNKYFRFDSFKTAFEFCESY